MSDNNDTETTVDATTEAEGLFGMADTDISLDASEFAGGGENDLYAEEHSLGGSGEEDIDTSDDVDPRKLVGEPTPSEVRWYFRNTPFAPTVVAKPVLDAFKHGYDTPDLAEEKEQFLEDWEEHRRAARICARRDGFSFIYFILDDENSASNPVENVDGYEGFNTVSLDNLACDPNTKGMQPHEIADHVDYDEEQLRVLDQGVVVVEDITSIDHHDIVGAIYQLGEDDPNREDKGNFRFIHADRLQHFVENPQVDGPLGAEWVGSVTGHPVLGPVFQEIKALAKTNWALGQTLFRYSAPLHAIEIDKDVAGNLGDIEEHIESMNEQTRDVNAASSLTLPPGHEVNAVSTGGEIDPTLFVEPLIEMLCAGTEFTKTVLMGTQSGTVSGSESDIKNYFNQVQRYRHTTAERQMAEALDMVFASAPTKDALEVDWGPLFRMDNLDTTEAENRVVTSLTNAVSNYVLTPDEARKILMTKWAELGSELDIDVDDLTDEQLDQLDRVNVGTEGKGKLASQESEGSGEGNPKVGQNGGGNEGNQSSSTPQNNGDASDASGGSQADAETPETDGADNGMEDDSGALADVEGTATGVGIGN